MKTFGSRLRALRESRQWSQEKLGFELGVTKATISKWESGHVRPGLDTLLSIKNLFAEDSLTLDFLAGERGHRREAGHSGGLRLAEGTPAYDSDLRVARSQAELQLLLGFRNLSGKRQKALLKLLTEDN